MKKDETLDKENYRPVSVLPFLSRAYEKLLYNRLFDHVENIFNLIFCGFRKAHRTQHALFKLLHSWQKELDEKGMVATVLMDLSKVYDCIPHDLLIAKLNTYGIDSVGFLLISDYLSRHKQRTKVSASYSSWYDIITGVPQGSLLGPLLFKVFINDLFLFLKFKTLQTIIDYTVSKKTLRMLFQT